MRKDKVERAMKAYALIKRAEKVINNGGKLMTVIEKEKWERNYKKTMNEGGYGYVPDHITVEDYESAKKIIETINQEE